MLRGKILRQSRLFKQASVGAVDAVLAVFATWLAFSLQLDALHWPQGDDWVVYVLSPVLALPVFALLGLYRAVFRYSGMAAVKALLQSMLLYGVLFAFVMLVWLPEGGHRSMSVLQPLLLLMLTGGARVFARHWLSGQSAAEKQQTKHLGRLLIYGAGTAGVQMAMALSRTHEFDLVGFVDDDVSVQGRNINGLHVYPPQALPTVVHDKLVSDLLLAIPSISRQRRVDILASLTKLPVHVRSLPALTDLAQGKVSLSDIQELDIQDLLGRSAVDPDPALLVNTLPGQVVLVTGAGGSIGSELCRQILSYAPESLVLVEHSEFALYAIHRELEAMRLKLDVTTILHPVLCNVQNELKVMEVFKTFYPNRVYHAAAYKHVPLVEHNPAEGVANNVFGTLNVAKAALMVQAHSMVLISTDKAVRPTNVMGASKRLSELVLQALAAADTLKAADGSVRVNMMATMGGTVRTVFPNRTVFSMVRFGNVLGSSGSVVPLFREQIAKGGPITLTDARVTRYFMTIPEAVHLVLQAGAMSKGGEVFVLDMGEPVLIYDLAQRMIELSGLEVRNANNPDGDIEITVTGLRPGEKLYEELLIGNDPKPTAHPRIMMAHEKMVPWPKLLLSLAGLRQAIDENSVPQIRDTLLELVDGFSPGHLIAEPTPSQAEYSI